MNCLRSFFLLALLSIPLQISGEAVFVDAGFEKYKAAEKAKASTENEAEKATQKPLLNQALSFYLHSADSAASGYLLYNIGNCYFELEEYGQAALYYERALKLRPRVRQIAANLEVTLKKASVVWPKEALWKRLLQMSWLSIQERKLFLLGALLFAFAFASLFLWLRLVHFRQLAIFSVVIALFFIFGLLYSSFVLLLEAVVVHPSILRQGPGVEYAKVAQVALLPAQKVEVLEVNEARSWYYVKVLPSGEEGYISAVDATII